jgi:hypothetical protein
MSGLAVVSGYTRQDSTLEGGKLATGNFAYCSFESFVKIAPHKKAEQKLGLFMWYTRQDSNLRPLGSKPSTLSS